MKVVDIRKRIYILTEEHMQESLPPLPNAVLRSELKDAVNTTIDYLRTVTSYYVAPWSETLKLFPGSWKVELTFFGRLHIGCRTFDRKNTKLIIEWARGAA